MLILNPDGSWDCEPTTTFFNAIFWLQAQAQRTSKNLVLNFNGGTRCTVGGKSNLGALNEAFLRGMQTKGPRVFGPSAPRPLPLVLQLSDASIDANRIKVDLTPEAERVKIWNKIGSTGYKVAPLARARWSEYVRMGIANQRLGRLGRTEVAAAWRVGCLAQALAGTGRLTRKSWDKCLRANFERANQGLVVAILQETWDPYNWQIRQFNP